MKTGNKRNIAVILLSLFIIMGVIIYDDYGISTDEQQERKTTLVNAKYIMNVLGHDGLSDLNEELPDYKDKYYGVILQLPCVVFEWMTGFKDDPSIYLYRHLYVFMVCTFGYICFYFLCRQLTKSCLMSLLAATMVAFYPRFFANQFYDIKDMVFASMYMVSMWITVQTISKKLKWQWLVLFAVLTAIATNVRIVGLIFPILLIGYIFFIWIIGKCGIEMEGTCIHPFRRILLILFCYFSSYVIMMPILWSNPIKGIINVFKKFSQFDEWNGYVVFMGEMVKGKEVPWYYIPIWLLISVPVWYWVLLLLMVAGGGILLYKQVKTHKKIFWLHVFDKYKYFIWLICLVLGPWLATVMFHSTLYNGWRHCFFLLPPLVLIIVYGLTIINEKLKIGRGIKIAVSGIIVIGLLGQSLWIIKNHPYQMVYLNAVGRCWGDQFDRDYWCLATTDMCRYVLNIDSGEKVSVNADYNNFERLLDKEEKARVIIEDEPTYWLESFRVKIGNDYVREGYEEIYAIMVDGYKIGSVQKKK